jgi:cobalt-zinc-cadmium efflux system membrane fusion protein
VPTVQGDQIKYSAEFAKGAGIKLEPVEIHEVAPDVMLPGSVQLDQRRSAAVGTRIPGRVRKIVKLEGEEVKAGEVLAEIESAELGHAQTDLLKARAKEEHANAEKVREQKLAQAKISALREAQAAEAAATAARAERLAAEQSLKALGGDPGNIGEIGVLQLRSPIDGRVLTSKLSRGQALEATATPFLIADLSRVAIRLELFERDLASVRRGDKVEVARQADPTRKVSGQVARMGEVIDPQTHTAEVWVEVDNADRWLRPGESVTARIRGTGDGHKWPAVPPAAIVTVDGKPTVFVGVGDDAVQIRPVTLGATGEKSTAVVSGLKEGDQVVVSGAFALKSEIFR